MKHLPSVTILRILVRNMKMGRATPEQIHASMTKRLNLARFVRDRLSEEDGARYDELVEFLRELEKRDS